MRQEATVHDVGRRRDTVLFRNASSSARLHDTHQVSLTDLPVLLRRPQVSRFYEHARHVRANLHRGDDGDSLLRRVLCGGGTISLPAAVGRGTGFRCQGSKPRLFLGESTGVFDVYARNMLGVC